MLITGNTLATADFVAMESFPFTVEFSMDESMPDIDMLATWLEGGWTYFVDVDPNDQPDLYLRIFDLFGREVTANDDRAWSTEPPGVAPAAGFTTTYSGIYYLAVSPYFARDYDPVTGLGGPDVENGIPVEAIGTLRVIGAFSPALPLYSAGKFIQTGSLGDLSLLLGDEDHRRRVEFPVEAYISSDTAYVVRLDLHKGEVVAVDVNGIADGIYGVALDSVLRVANAAGEEIAFDDGVGTETDAELIFVAPAAGSYYIGVSGQGNDSYDLIEGTGKTLGAEGSFTIVLHRNPTVFGTRADELRPGTPDNDYAIGLKGADTLGGLAGFDTLSGGDGADSISGGDGDDQLFGEQQADTLDGGRGRDMLFGGDGADLLIGGTTTANDLLLGGRGNDTLTDGNGADTLDGGDGADSLTGGAGNNRLTGGAGNDTLLAGNNADTLLGGDGNDSMNAGIGANRLEGATGADTLIAGTGNDTALGGEGNDFVNTGDGANSLDGGSGADTLRGGAGADTILGGDDADLIVALGGNDRANGGLGADTLVGGDGADSLVGGDGDDSLNGGAGADTLVGGRGNDLLAGGADADIFVFNATNELTDTILDFAVGTDLIRLAGMFRGAASAANLAEYVQVTQAGLTDSFLAVDANGLTGGLAFTIIAQVKNLLPGQLFAADNFIL
jgi:Ca2+-binding RTX toxin-like protein